MSQTYAEERAAPTHPQCARSAISLIFDGRHVRGIGAKTPMMYPAVSGKRNKQGRFDYSVDRQKIPFQGPIPEGEYWIQPSEMWENNWFKSMIRTPHTAWGNFRSTIHPYPSTETHGRGGFFLHGGTVPGSAGCIDLTSHMDVFVETLKKELQGLPKCFIPLSVRYSQG